LQHWEEKTKMPDEDWRSEKTKKIYFDMLDSQRSFLTEANKDPTLNEEIIRHQLYLIDLEEERVKLL
jgi:CPA1 family monovalent cation:H+ antiporter